MNDDIVILTKDEALDIANIKSNQIHCFLNASFGLIGADHSKKEFLDELNKAEKVEVGGKVSRRIGHALILWQGSTAYFFEHNEDRLTQFLKEREKN